MASSAQTPHAQPADQLDNRRTVAAAIDCGPFVVAAAALLGAGLLTPATAVVVLAWMAYYAFAFESGGEQTLGKRAMKLKTVDAEGNPPTMRQAGIRSAMRIVDLPMIGLIAMVASKEQRQRLGDRVAGTYVVDASGAAAADQAVTERLATLAPGHVPADPPPAEKPKRKSLGGPEIKLPKLGRRKKAAPVAATPAPVAPAAAEKPRRKSLGGPEIKLPKLGRKAKVYRPKGAKPKRKTLGGPEIKLPKFGRRKQADAAPDAFAPEERPLPVVPDSPIPSAPAEPIAHEPEVAFDDLPEVAVEREPEGSFAEEPDVLGDAEPEVPFADEPEVTVEREPEVMIDDAPEVVIAREPEVSFDHDPEPAAEVQPEPEPAPEPAPRAEEDPTIEVKPIETVSAIDLVMQNADQNHRPGA